MNDSLSYFLQDSVLMLIQQAREAKRDEMNSNTDYDKGKLMAYYEVLCLLRQQAIAFGIPLEAISLDMFDPDLELL